MNNSYLRQWVGTMRINCASKTFILPPAEFCLYYLTFTCFHSFLNLVLKTGLEYGNLCRLMLCDKEYWGRTSGLEARQGMKTPLCKRPACYEMLRGVSDLDGFFQTIEVMEYGHEIWNLDCWRSPKCSLIKNNSKELEKYKYRTGEICATLIFTLNFNIMI
jgi:hypothetical protein